MSPNQPPNPPPGRPANPYPISSAIASSGGGHPSAEDLTLYGMQLFPSDEAAGIALHLERCQECRAELARVHSDLAAYASTVELEAPPAVARQRLIQQVAREKKIVAGAATPAAPAQPQAPAPIAQFGRSGSVLSIEDHPPKRRVAAILAGIGWAAAAGLAVAAGLLYQDRAGLRTNFTAQSAELQRLTADAASAHQLMDALTDPKALRVTLTPKAQPAKTPIGGITYNPDKGALVFLASDLNPLQQYKAYELWILPAGGGAPIPAGTFHPDDRGNASVIMPDLPKGVPAKAFAITIEPDGGSQTPTFPVIMSGS
jgi:anti-sigma-K factor RskA